MNTMKTFRNPRHSRKTRRSLSGGTVDWYTLPGISFKDYVRCVKPLYTVLEKKNTSTSDPDIFLQTILAGHSKLTVEQWNQGEKQRLYEKALSMKMGDFHEELMGKFPGYETLPVGHTSGTDVRKLDDSEFFEVKNRDNTMNSGSAESVIRKLTKLRDEGKQAMLVMINSEKKTLPRFKAPKDIKVLNGKQIYEYLSGDKSFHDTLIDMLRRTFTQYPTYASLEAAVQK